MPIIDNNTLIAPNIYRMSIIAEDIAQNAKAGQFVHVKCSDYHDPLLRRPISVSEVNLDKGEIYLIYQVRGRGTKWMSKQGKGAKIDIIGPLGNTFESLMPSPVNDIWLVGGGIGIFPLQLFAQQHTNKKNITSILGFRDIEFKPLWQPFTEYSNELIISTEDGSFGNKGFVTESVLSMLKIRKPHIIITCGPIEMLKAIVNISKANEIPCLVSLEERMGCGIGACLVCSCKIKSDTDWHYRRVCADGPVFWGHEVIFNE